MKYQPRNKRYPKGYSPARLDERIQNAVERDAIRWSCSKSWVTACALAAFYDIDIMKPFEVKRKLKIVKRRKSA